MDKASGREPLPEMGRLAKSEAGWTDLGNLGRGLRETIDNIFATTEAAARGHLKSLRCASTGTSARLGTGLRVPAQSVTCQFEG